MADKLIVTDQITINAPTQRVWEVLTDPAFIKQWDEMPENYSGGVLKMGSVIDWEGYSKLTVTEFEPGKVLKMNMFLPKVALSPSQYDVSYKYSLTDNDGITTLDFEFGDFSPLPKAQNYYDTTQEFVEMSKEKIKELAEGMG